MRYSNMLWPLVLLSFYFIACKHEPEAAGQQVPDTVIAPRAASIEEALLEEPLVEVPAVTSDANVLDSMMRIEVTLPRILDEKAYDTATVNSFTRLADLTKGEMKLLASADLLEKNITDILCKNSTDYADVLFLVDNSGSMEDDIAAVKEGMNQIIDVLKEQKSVRLAIATYRDKQYNKDWFTFREFETDYAAAKKFTDSMTLLSNADLPESVYEAFFAAADQKFWRSRTKRVVLIVGDARAKEKADGGMYNIEDMLKKAGESNIKVNFFPLIVTPYSEKYRVDDHSPKSETETHIIQQIFPNPTNGAIQIKLSQEGRYRIAVYTMTGLMIEDQYMDGELWMIDMRNRDNGLYVIRVTDKNNQYDVGKFILRR